MIDPLIRRPVVPSTTTSTASTTSTSTVSTTQAASATAPKPPDVFKPKLPAPVSLGGTTPAPAAVPARAKADTGAATGVGPRLDYLDEGWTPQGQGYDPETGEVLTTYYDDCRGVLLTLQDKDTGEETGAVKLGGKGGPLSLIGPPGHGGGVSVEGELVYVADTHLIYVYRREDIENADPDGPPVEAIHVSKVPELIPTEDDHEGLVSAGSYMTVKDGYAYVGGYSKDGDGKVGAVWRYEIDEKTGELIEGSRKGPIRAPDRAQGVTVVDGGLLFTTGDQKLVYQPVDADGFEADIAYRVDISNGLIDPYAQGLNVIDGELWVTYESGSQKYREGVEEKGGTPREHIQRIPLEDLDLEAAGLTPEELEG